MAAVLLRRAGALLAAAAAALLWLLLGGSDPAGAQVRDTPPIGSWDTTVARDGTITVEGWAFDPDARGPVTVAMLTPRGFVVARTGLPRPDVWFAPNSGFRMSVDGIPPGPTAACVGAANAGPAGGSVGFGCRAFTMVDTRPIGVVDRVWVERDRIRVQGWGAVPGSAEIVDARLAVDGAVVTVAASGHRPDLLAAGFVGAAHGFDLRSPPLRSGTRPICVAVARRGEGGGRLLHCQYVTLHPPIGVVDQVRVSGSSIVVSGWNLDPDAPHEALATTITADRLEDFSDPLRFAMMASLPRPDVAAAMRSGPNRGFAHTFGSLPAGTYRVCVSVAEAGTGPAVSLGCRNVSVVQHSPVGALDEVTTTSNSSVRVRGWMRDPDTTAEIPVTVTAGGVTQVVTTSGMRFDVTLTGVPAGVHEVCVTAAGVGQGAPTTLPCGTVVLGAIRVASTGWASSSSPVGPPSGTPLAGIDRDAGISTRLRDGSVLWLFGDSAEPTVDGGFRYFVNNTAAWAPAATPAKTRDAVAAGTRPHPFVLPGPTFPSCPTHAPSKAMWPLSAVAVPAGPRDRVIAYFQNMCLGPKMAAESRGVAVVEWLYDPATPPDGTAITGTITNQRLFPTNTYGNAAVVGDDGLLYVYACDGSDGGWLPDAFGRCRVARVDPDDVADVTEYRWWDGADWVTDPDDSVLMDMPDGVRGTDNPVATLTVTRDPVHDVYVMAYSSWPGFSDKVAIRVATSPEGPWTPPVSVALPGCSDVVAGEGRYCYAATAQPAFSTVDSSGIRRIGIGWYDQAVAANPTRGSYRVSQVPFEVVV